ncbi:MAG: sialidase family protein [Anaerolineales bacterium]|nr:sialidase family protein [Anaerolineales bacterium]
MNNLREKPRKFLISLVISAVLAAIGVSALALAQAGDLSWENPTNLSKSGSASNPIMVVTSDGILHVIWNDSFLDYFYTSFDGEAWTEPETVPYPFDDEGESAPLLVADNEGNIHAFWTNEDNTLFTSQVSSNNFGRGFGWSSVLRLAPLVSVFDVSVDEQDRLFLSFIRYEDYLDSPAGVYFRRSFNDGFTWSSEETIYTSPYLRSEEPEGGNLNITADVLSDEESRIYLVWDNPLRERVFYSMSADNGETWQEPVEIDAPDTDSNITDPFNIDIYAADGEALIVWQVGDPEGTCQNQYQWSPTAGASWTAPQLLSGNEIGCERGIEFVEMSDGLVLFLTVDFDGYSLRAWDGALWGSAQPQEKLTSFTDPETFNKLELECPQIAVHGDDQLYFIGCATDLSGDIWITHRENGDLLDWFPVAENPTWSPIEPIEFTNQPVGDLRTVVDNEGRLHIVWDTPLDAEQSDTASSLIYTRLENGVWSSPNAVVSSPNGPSNHPDLVIDEDDRLHLVWSGGEEGNIYYSWADASIAVSSSEWVDPVQLPAPDVGASSPTIFIDPSGTIYVAYAITVNESRGIYLTSSRDSGETWETSIEVFNAAGAGWEMVDAPRLTGGLDGSLYLLWTRYTLPSGVRPVALYYSRSLDQGGTWDSPESLYNGQIDWSEILATSSGDIHRMWQVTEAGIPNMYHWFTRDGGETWNNPDHIPGLGDGGVTNIAADPGGQLQLLNLSADIIGDHFVRHWRWDGSAWISEESLNLGSRTIAEANSISGAVSASGELSAILSGFVFGTDPQDTPHSLLFTQREIDLTGGPITSEPVPTVTIAPTQASIATATPSPTPAPTRNFANDQVNPGQLGFFGLNSSIAAPIIGLIGSAVITLGAVSVILVLRRRRA